MSANLAVSSEMSKGYVDLAKSIVESEQETAIQIFRNPHFGEIRVSVNNQGEPMFCLVDVCRALEIKNPRDVKTRLNGKGVVNADTLTNGGLQSMTYISEPNLYKCIFQSRVEKAEQFQDWVCEDILPSIRRHGIYATPQTIDHLLADPDNAIKVFQTLKQERELRRIAEAKIEADSPKVLFADAVAGSKSACLIGELAKVISQNGHPIGQNRLFKWMRDNNYLGRHGERYNIPNQQYIEMGLFELKKNIHSENGVMKTTMTPKVTGKGQQYFINKFLGNRLSA